MALRCMLCLLLGCATAPQSAPTTRTSPEVRAFEADLGRCDQDGEEAANACQEALLVAAACDSGGQGPVCDHLRGRGYLRHDSRAYAGYYTSTAVGVLQLLVDEEELVLRVPATLIRARLRRSDVTPPAVPGFDEVCEATRRCLEAQASRDMPGDAEGPDTSVEIHAWRASECHCQLLAAAAGDVTWAYGFVSQWDEPPEPRERPAACDVESLPYDDSMLPVCLPP